MKSLTQKDKSTAEAYIAIFTVLVFLLAMLVIIGYGIWFLTLLPWKLFINWLIREYNNIPTVMMPLFIAGVIVSFIIEIVKKR